MTPENFTYWLQGFFEISSHTHGGLTHEQVQVIKDHLGLVFNKVTPNRGGDKTGFAPYPVGPKFCSGPKVGGYDPDWNTQISSTC